MTLREPQHDISNTNCLHLALSEAEVLEAFKTRINS